MGDEAKTKGKPLDEASRAEMDILNVGGDILKEVPKADAAVLMWVLHDWSDNDCIQILRNCRDAIPRDKGKVITVEAVIEEEEEEEGEGGDGLKCGRLTLDMVMMAHTRPEWKSPQKEAGFSGYNIKPIPDTIQSLIEAFP